MYARTYSEFYKLVDPKILELNKYTEVQAKQTLEENDIPLL